MAIGAPTGTKSALLSVLDHKSLMLKLTDNPPAVLPGVLSLDGLKGDWWVAHTKPRSEKALAFELLRKDVPYYLPLISRITFSGGRKRKVLYPLFPGYLFFCGGNDERLIASYTRHVAQVLPVVNRETFVDEVTRIQQLLAGDAMLDLYPFAVVGARCRIRAGAFMGIEGVVVRRDKRTLLVLQVSILGSGAALEIDASLLEPVE